KQSEYQKTQAELNQLKGQLNPHFLFNTLHGIYALALERDARAPDAILQLSKLLDYSLTGPDQHFVNLQDDIDHLQDYIELNQLRLSPKTTLEVDLVGNYTAHTVAPFLLLPFVENAFKYGVSTAVASRIVISATVSQQRLHFTCRNRRFTGRSSGKGHAIGIENVRRRLMLLYPQRHELSLQQSKTHYEVTLTIDLAHEVVASATTIPVS
ncbi:MAG: histidine kinase, partial [Bacteroidota bacterium]